MPPSSKSRRTWLSDQASLAYWARPRPLLLPELGRAGRSMRGSRPARSSRSSAKPVEHLSTAGPAYESRRKAGRRQLVDSRRFRRWRAQLASARPGQKSTPAMATTRPAAPHAYSAQHGRRAPCPPRSHRPPSPPSRHPGTPVALGDSGRVAGPQRGVATANAASMLEAAAPRGGVDETRPR